MSFSKVQLHFPRGLVGNRLILISLISTMISSSSTISVGDEGGESIAAFSCEVWLRRAVQQFRSPGDSLIAGEGGIPWDHGSLQILIGCVIYTWMIIPISKWLITTVIVFVP